jgi:hypothetical protein
MYLFALGLVVLIVFFLGMQEKPYQTINTQKSYLICPDGHVEHLKDLGISFYDAERNYNHAHKTGERTCSIESQNKKDYINVKLPNDKILNFPESMSQEQITDAICLAFPEYIDQIKDPNIRSGLKKRLFSLPSQSEITNYWATPKEEYEDKLSEIDWIAVYPTYWVSEKHGSWFNVIKFWSFGLLITFLSLNILKQSILYIAYGKKFNLLLVNNIFKMLRRPTHNTSDLN